MAAIERGREDAAHDVDEGEESGEESGGVTERDADDVRGQPDVGVQHGAHHFHGVAVHGEMVRDEEGDEAEHRRGRAADAVAVEAFEENAQQDRAPADEDGGGIEIGHGRPPFQIHARDQPERNAPRRSTREEQRRSGRASRGLTSQEAQARMKMST